MRTYVQFFPGFDKRHSGAGSQLGVQLGNVLFQEVVKLSGKLAGPVRQT